MQSKLSILVLSQMSVNVGEATIETTVTMCESDVDCHIYDTSCMTGTMSGKRADNS